MQKYDRGGVANPSDPRKAASKDVISRYTQSSKSKGVPSSVKEFLTHGTEGLSPFEIRNYSKQMGRTNPKNIRVASRNRGRRA